MSRRELTDIERATLELILTAPAAELHESHRQVLRGLLDRFALVDGDREQEPVAWQVGADRMGKLYWLGEIMSKQRAGKGIADERWEAMRPLYATPPAAPQDTRSGDLTWEEHHERVGAATATLRAELADARRQRDLILNAASDVAAFQPPAHIVLTAPQEDTRDAERWRYFRERAWVGTDEDGEVCAGVSFGISEEADGLTDAERATLANNTFSDDHDTADVCDRLVDAALPSNPSGEDGHA